MTKRAFTIITEVTSDLPVSYFKKHDVLPVEMIYTLDQTEYDGTFENSLSPREFYDALRNNQMAKTVAVPPDKMAGIFEEEMKQGNDVLHLAFSSGLSSTYQACTMAREEVLEKYPEGKIYVVDTLCASLGQGLLVDYAVRQRDAGKSIEETVQAVEEIKHSVCHLFTVSDLHFLHRGGRVSKTVAVVGTVLGIKPVMYVDDEGHLIPYGKIRGRKQSLDELVAHMGKKLGDYENPYVFISHGDCYDEARYVSDQVRLKYGIPTEIINFIGPVIGSHSGPGTVALFFIGRDRKEG